MGYGNHAYKGSNNNKKKYVYKLPNSNIYYFILSFLPELVCIYNVITIQNDH